ncbi:PEP-CTERM sorting domain-containing protein [Desulfobacterales bacterium HSG2]|nr:PEP-CTERM sorting domain-containing protein [Desulfobacterales bacterium HSG2]
MKKFAEILGVSMLVVFLTVGSAFAFGTDITIFDENSSGEGINDTLEDNEAEPGMVQSQAWDLEGFFLNDDNELTMIGGYDFVNGEAELYSGDVFIDVNGDAEFGDIHDWGNVPNATVTDTFGYDYVLDMDFDNLTYDVYKLDEDSTTQIAFYGQNQGSNPWRYVGGGEEVESGVFGYETMTDAQTGFDGWGTNSHNVVSGLDLNFLASDVPVEFISHFTMQCGNDNLMGEGTLAATATGGGGGSAAPGSEAPEPATMFLLGSGLIGLANLRKRFNKKG